MTPEALARLHATSFTGAARWSEAGFAALLSDPATFLNATPNGAILGRVTLDEAELLTLIVHPDHRGRGCGRTLLAAFETAACANGAREAFLEVAEDNQPARALYASSGWHAAGRRPGYYAGKDALILRKTL
ncbi:ribosomal-protein-alanine N-acetyltransferase [Jannaschia seosinensis]|uniref:Ribosomal-protein-alanine N-acetyltransferase n=1 Tax=Jannaschia seosinensis TaxID=313367 RepID=A0A0M7B9K6_9RHOB|nr:GNAT family N-acetyltransferase [Jannaschia seosinensis]CUH38879.1 ribosomal-protein-alanine N-acetyltransferase [Jannaschia seosinensis]